MQDKGLIIRRFERSYESYNKLAVVQQEIAQRLALRIRQFLVDPKNGVEIGSGTGFLTRWIVEYYPNCEWIANDIVTKSKNFLPQQVKFIEGDGEFLQLPENQDIIVSASTVQWFGNFEQFVAKSKNALKKDGIIAISSFGKNNFHEISQLTGETLNYLSKSELEACFSGFEILYSEEWTQKLLFKTPIEVLQHIKATGVNAISQNRWTNARLKQFCVEYVDKFGSPTLTFNPIIIIARKNG